MFVLLMIKSGCSTKVQIKPNENYQENQLALCPVTLPRLAGPTGSDFDAALKAYSRYSFSNLGREIHKAFPVVDSLHFSLTDIVSELSVPRLSGLTVEIEND